MDVQSLQRWHWIVIGLIAGAVVGGGRLMAVSDKEVGGPDFITQAQFERELRLPPIELSKGKPQPYITGLAIHQAKGVDLVSFRELDTETLEYKPRWFAAPRPYKSLGALSDVPAGYTVADYLSEAQPPVGFSNAWWETPGGAMAIWVGGGAVVIGGIWPFILNLLIGAGLGRKPKEQEYDLSRFKSEEAPQAQKQVSEEDRKRMEELEAEMIAGLNSEGDRPQAQAARQPGVLKELHAEEVVEAPVGPREQKDYVGEYYPVEKPGRHEATHADEK